jgi:hypothetical protein
MPTYAVDCACCGECLTVDLEEAPATLHSVWTDGVNTIEFDLTWGTGSWDLRRAAELDRLLRVFPRGQLEPD